MLLLLSLACVEPPPPPRVEAPPSAPPVDPRVPDRPFGAVRLAIAELLPGAPPSPFASTYAIRDNDAPPDGVRERQGEVIVFTRAEVIAGGANHFDGLRVGDRVLMDAAPPPGPDRAPIADRVLQLAYVGPERVSARILTSELTEGAAHSNNALDCGTWSRATGARLTLYDILGEAEAERRLARVAKIHEDYGRGDDEAYYTLGFFELREARWPIGDTENVLVDNAADPILCLPIVIGAGGETWLVRLSAG